MRVTLILHMITIRLATLFLLFRTSSSTSSDAGTSAFSKPYESIEENGSSIAIPKIATVAFAADGYGRYLSKLLAVVEQLRSAPNGQSYRLIAYNLGGVPNATAQALRCAAPRLLDELRDFNFSAFPAHVKDLHCYAWKPLLLLALRREFPRQGLVWLDSGVELVGGPGGFLERALAAAAAQGGVVSDKTADNLERWTFEGTFQYFDREFGYPKAFFLGERAQGVNAVHNCNGAFSAWSPLLSIESQPLDEFTSSSTNSTTSPPLSMSLNSSSSLSTSPPMHDFAALANASVGTRAMAMWARCALVRACVCPKGSSRRNHRQDQAALTLALASQGVRCYDSDTVKPSDHYDRQVDLTTDSSDSNTDQLHNHHQRHHHPYNHHNHSRLNGTTFVVAHGNTLRSCADNDPLCYLRKHAPECL